MARVTWEIDTDSNAELPDGTMAMRADGYCGDYPEHSISVAKAWLANDNTWVVIIDDGHGNETYHECDSMEAGMLFVVEHFSKI